MGAVGLSGQPLNVVLIAPEIPPNTGNVARLCVSTETALHLVEPLGFSLSDRYLKRAGLDYWQHLKLTVHKGVPELLTTIGDGRVYLATAHAERPHTSVPFGNDDWLVFGNETGGLPASLQERVAADGIKIPMWGPSRCLNLSNAVAVVLFEALRQVHPSRFPTPN